jgi:hypothetical protein
MAGYRPMTLADLAGHLSRAADDRTRWKLTWEFLEEYRWESSAVQPSLLRDEPPGTGDERWDALLAALAEHLAAQHDLAPPEWAELRVLQRPWFPAELKVQRADALVRAGRIPQARGLLVRCGPGSSVTGPGGVLGKDDPARRRVFDHPGLRVTAASPRHIFAMKALAARTRDVDDLRLLAGIIEVDSAETALRICAEFFPDEQVPPRAAAVLQELLG